MAASGSNRRLSPATRVAQALRYIDEDTGAIIPPIQLTATYARDANYNIRKPYYYKRDGGPTTEQSRLGGD